MTAALGIVAELWRYPVKSMRGERVERLQVVRDGITHDRRYAFESSGAPAGKPLLTGRERAAMLLYAARVEADQVLVQTPAGETFSVCEPGLLRYLEQHLPQGNRIVLRRSEGAGPFTDVRPIALVSSATLQRVGVGYGDVDARRFRANLLLHLSAETVAQLTGGEVVSFPENFLTGRVLRFGEHCRLRVLERVPRCRVITLSPDTAEADPELVKHLDRRHGGRLGVYAAVETPGEICSGDTITLA